MSAKPYPRSFGSLGRPTRPRRSKRRARDTQPELDQRCVACRAGSHRNCMTAGCSCTDTSHHREDAR